MAKTTSIALGAHFNDFLTAQVASGRYGSVSEAVRAGLRLLEERGVKLAELRAALQAGEASGFIDFEPEKWLAGWKADWLAREDSNKPRRAG